MSFGGKISRYLATKYERVAKMVLMGTKLGLGVIVKICNEIQAFCEHPPPIIPAQIEGTLDPKSQSQEDREFLGGFNIPVIMAGGETVLRWPSVEPADFLCPALQLIISEDRLVIPCVRESEQSLRGARVQH